MKKIIQLLMLAAVFTLTGFTLTGFTPAGEIAQAQTTWIPLDTVNNVEFYYHQSSCSGDTVLFLKVVNNNIDSVTVTWSLWPEGASHKLSFSGMQQAIGDCTEASPQDLWEYIPAGLSVANLNPVITTQ